MGMCFESINVHGYSTFLNHVYKVEGFLVHFMQY